MMMMTIMTGAGGDGGGGGGKDEDKFLVPVIEDDYNWFRLCIAYLEEDGGISGESGGLWRNWEVRDGDERLLQGKANLAGTYDPYQRWETSYQEMEADVPVEMNANRGVGRELFLATIVTVRER